MDASKQIDKAIKSLPDWRGKLMAQLRKLIHKADPDITEEWKWGTPVFSHNGLVCAIGAFKDHAGVNFFQGAALKDPKKVFNGGLDAKKMRTINLWEGDKLDEKAFVDLVKQAVGFNQTK